MCGFAGFLATAGGASADATLRRMTDAIRHRGPDADGFWSDEQDGIALGHRRLAIIDTSPGGAQPMLSADGRYALAYNGEIYNFADIRAELESAGEAPEWRGHSDTEVLLAAIVAWGVERTLQRAAGMFALALWDRQEKRLVLARDRLGEKPLYYGWQRNGGQAVLLFGSDLAALREHPAFEGRVDADAVRSLAQFNYIPAPLSIYQGIAKLAPGTWLEFAGDAQPGSTGTEHAYWRLADRIEGAGKSAPVRGDEAVDLLGEVLGGAVERQMVSDVPLGAFLSGGIDSSTIVALMQQRSTRPVKTFTIGFAEAAYNEADTAREVAAHLGTEHHELTLQPRDALDLIPLLPEIYTEPFADSSQLPTYLVSRFARESVTVALSGDAGDELFGGYNRHLFVSRYWPRLQAVPGPLRKALASALLALPAPALNAVGARFFGDRIRLLGDKLYKAGLVTGSGDVDDLYARLVAAGWDHRDLAAQGGMADDGAALPPGMDPVARIMALDMLGYLPGDILAKVDRAAMAVSLETRIPMLDPEVVDLALRIPVEDKIRDGVGKWPVRRLLERHVPRELFERPKMGFGVPLDTWLRGPLKDWGEGLLDYATRELQEYFDPARLRRLWQEHQKGAANRQSQLWPVLIFADWSRTNAAR